MKKNIITIFALGCLLVSGTSCSDYLDRTPLGEISTDGIVTQKDLIALTNSAYQPLQWAKIYNMRMWTTDIIAGNSVVGAGGGTDGIETVDLSNFTASSDNAAALDIWRGPNPGILRCNLVLQNAEKAEDISEEVRDRCIGEAYFLRAHYYFILVRFFGDVPLILEPQGPSSDLHQPRTAKEKVYEQIIADCNKAIELLPVKSAYSDEDRGRACKDAALAMLAKVYLTQGNDYEKVVELCNQVAALGYDLSAYDYAMNFDATVNNGPESLFEVQYSGDPQYGFWNDTNQSSWLSTYMGPRNSDMVAGGWGWNQPTQEFINSYEPGDKRKDVTVFYEGCPKFDNPEAEKQIYKPEYSGTGYNVRKFVVSKSIADNLDKSPLNFVVYRYADVLLMKAEALNELNRTGEAEDALNIVRHRAGLPDIKGQAQSQLKELILHERRIELAFEGHRWFDLIRVDNGDYAIKFLHSIGKTNATKDRLLFPIPQQERDANPNLTQNNGY